MLCVKMNLTNTNDHIFFFYDHLFGSGLLVVLPSVQFDISFDIQHLALVRTHYFGI